MWNHTHGQAVQVQKDWNANNASSKQTKKVKKCKKKKHGTQTRETDFWTCSINFTVDHFSWAIKLMRAKTRNWTCSNYRRTSRPPAYTPRAQEVTRESRQWLITIDPPLPSHRASASVAPDAKIINAVAVIPGPCSHGDEKIFPQVPLRLSSSS